MPSERQQGIARELARLFPDSIGKELLNDREFRERTGLRTLATIRLSGSDAVFSRNTVLESARRVFSPTSTEETVNDQAGGSWRLAWNTEADAPVLEKDGVAINLEMLWPVAADDAVRAERMNRMFTENRAIGEDFDAWRAYLAEEPIDFEDVDLLQEDLQRTPVQNAIGLRLALTQGTVKPDVLTPTGNLYYERLVGAPAGAGTLSEFVSGPAKRHFASLLEWNAERGLRQALLAGSQSGLVPDLTESFDLLVLERVVAWAARQGDRISQVAAFELGIRHLRARPSLMDGLVSIGEQIRDDDPADPEGRLLLLSNLFIFVDGSLAHMGYLRGLPPFWRRLAALAQASMVERTFIARGSAPSVTNVWLESGRGTPFYLQNSIDGRQEPRWIPDLATPQQWKRELVSRIIGAAERNIDVLDGTALETLVRSTEPGSLRSQLEFPLSYLPGPLEGGLDSLVDAPPEFEQAIRESVEVAVTDPTSLVALVNTCLIFRTPTELAEQAAEAIRAAKYRIRQNSEPGRNFAMLSGLALVAAATRSEGLAAEIRVLARVALRRSGSDFTALQSFRIAIVASNALSGLNEWCRLLGDWATELALSDLTKEDAAQLLDLIQTLCDLEPALWATMSRAEAALTGYINAA